MTVRHGPALGFHAVRPGHRSIETMPLFSQRHSRNGPWRARRSAWVRPLPSPTAPVKVYRRNEDAFVEHKLSPLRDGVWSCTGPSRLMHESRETDPLKLERLSGSQDHDAHNEESPHCRHGAIHVLLRIPSCKYPQQAMLERFELWHICPSVQVASLLLRQPPPKLGRLFWTNALRTE